MELQNNKYYYINNGVLTYIRDIDPLSYGTIFCYVTEFCYHFGERHQTLIAHFLKEEQRGLTTSQDLYNKLLEYDEA